LDRLTLYDEHMILLLREQKVEQVNEAFRNSRLPCNLKQFKSLKHLDINLGWIIYFSDKAFSKSFEALRHHKDLSTLHFYTTSDVFHWSIKVKKRVRFLSDWILQISPKTEIRLSLHVSEQNQALDDVATLIKGICEHSNFTSACFNLSYALPELVRQLIALLKDSKSLAKLSLNVDSSDFGLEEFFLSLTEVKLPKYLAITLKYSTLTYPKLKRILPLIEKIAKGSHLRLTLENPNNCSIGQVEWRLFKREIAKFDSPHKIHAQLLGKTGRFANPMFSFSSLSERWRRFVFFLVILLIVFKIIEVIYFIKYGHSIYEMK